MRLNVLVVTPAGLYAEREIEVAHIQNGLGRIQGVLDKIPDTIQGEEFLDWTRIQVTFTR